MHLGQCPHRFHCLVNNRGSDVSRIGLRMVRADINSQMSQPYGACLSHVYNRGRPPISFLEETVAWAKKAPDEIFAPNTTPVEIFTIIKSSLATVTGHDSSGTPIYAWDSLVHRKAALLETMRVHAGMESSWNWPEGVDVTNTASVRNITGQEAGVFQVSFDSTYLAHGAMKAFAESHGIAHPANFIAKMKSDHALACEYYARLVRFSIAWAGPLLRHGDDSIYPWLRRAAVTEFQALLK